MTTIARIARLLLSPLLSLRSALCAIMDAWRDTLDEMPEIAPLTAEEYHAISAMLDAGMESEYDFASYD